jgi:hypothetical protein
MLKFIIFSVILATAYGQQGLYGQCGGIGWAGGMQI